MRLKLSTRGKPKSVPRPSVRNEALSALVGSLDLILDWCENPRMFRRRHFFGVMSHDEWLKIVSAKRERQALKRMQEKQWLDVKRRGDEVVYSLSKDAMATTLKEKIRDISDELPEGSLCLVVFDIPVGARSTGAAWRRFLHSAGFRRRQLSVWGANKDATNEVNALIKLLGIERWCEVFQCQLPEQKRG